MKFALVSHVLPPTWSGQSVVIHRLLSGLSAERYCLISRADYSTPADGEQHMPQLPGKYYHLPPEFRTERGGYRFGFINSARALLNTVIGIVSRAWRIAGIVRRERCDALVGCSGDLMDPPATYLASRLTGVPYFPYFFDYYAYQFSEPRMRAQATFMEPYLVRGAKEVIVPNEVLGEKLQERYGVKPVVIHNPSELLRDASLDDLSSKRSGNEIRITYTGAVYDAHFDAFRNLLIALEMLGRDEIRLHIYTALPRDYLEANGIKGRVVLHDHVATEAVASIQQQADILFLPLAFDSPFPEVIESSAPGKLGEYLSAAGPVLVHAPPNSFPSWYFRKHECGVVVDQSDPALLARAIELILSDANLRETLKKKARERAASDFTLLAARNKFLDVVYSKREGS
jgi:glycosyltransferase involved in cell wall biosynthesis